MKGFFGFGKKDGQDAAAEQPKKASITVEQYKKNIEEVLKKIDQNFENITKDEGYIEVVRQYKVAYATWTRQKTGSSEMGLRRAAHDIISFYKQNITFPALIQVGALMNIQPVYSEANKQKEVALTRNLLTMLTIINRNIIEYNKDLDKLHTSSRTIQQYIRKYNEIKENHFERRKAEITEEHNFEKDILKNLKLIIRAQARKQGIDLKSKTPAAGIGQAAGEDAQAVAAALAAQQQAAAGGAAGGGAQAVQQQVAAGGAARSTSPSPHQDALEAGWKEDVAALSDSQFKFLVTELEAEVESEKDLIDEAVKAEQEKNEELVGKLTIPMHPNQASLERYAEEELAELVAQQQAAEARKSPRSSQEAERRSRSNSPDSLGSAKSTSSKRDMRPVGGTSKSVMLPGGKARLRSSTVFGSSDDQGQVPVKADEQVESAAHTLEEVLKVKIYERVSMPSLERNFQEGIQDGISFLSKVSPELEAQQAQLINSVAKHQEEVDKARDKLTKPLHEKSLDQDVEAELANIIAAQASAASYSEKFIERLDSLTDQAVAEIASLSSEDKKPAAKKSRPFDKEQEINEKAKEIAEEMSDLYSKQQSSLEKARILQALNTSYKEYGKIFSFDGNTLNLTGLKSELEAELEKQPKQAQSDDQPNPNQELVEFISGLCDELEQHEATLGRTNSIIASAAAGGQVAGTARGTSPSSSAARSTSSSPSQDAEEEMTTPRSNSLYSQGSATSIGSKHDISERVMSPGGDEIESVVSHEAETRLSANKGFYDDLIGRVPVKADEARSKTFYPDLEVPISKKLPRLTGRQLSQVPGEGSAAATMSLKPSPPTTRGPASPHMLTRSLTTSTQPNLQNMEVPESLHAIEAGAAERNSERASSSGGGTRSNPPGARSNSPAAGVGALPQPGVGALPQPGVGGGVGPLSNSPGAGGDSLAMIDQSLEVIENIKEEQIYFLINIAKGLQGNNKEAVNNLLSQIEDAQQELYSKVVNDDELGYAYSEHFLNQFYQDENGQSSEFINSLITNNSKLGVIKTIFDTHIARQQAIGLIDRADQNTGATQPPVEKRGCFSGMFRRKTEVTRSQVDDAISIASSASSGAEHSPRR